MDILGSVVLIDPDTDETYRPTASTLSDPKNFGEGLMGIIVLIDPETGEPYALEH